MTTSPDQRRPPLLAAAFVLAYLGALVPWAAASGFDDHRLFTVEGPQPGASFGAAVASAGDVNGDGFPDLIVGAPGQDGVAGADCGAAFVFYGSATGFSASPSWSAEGETAGSRFGTAVASAGDVNGDGFGDVVVGAPGFDIPNEFHLFGAGRFYVYLGSASGLSLEPVLAASGHQYDLGAREGIGGTLATGDFNGDGFADVVAGQYAKYSTSGADVYYGSPAGPSAGAVWSMPFVVTYQGKFVVVANVNGDAFDDLIVTTLNQEGLPNQAIVFLGSAQGLPELPEGGSPPGVPPAFLFDKWSNVARIGDLDHDGYDDFLVTFGDFYNNETIFHWVYKGSPAGPVPWGEPSPALLTPGRLTPLGDVNGDGSPDVVAQDGPIFYFYYGSPSGLRAISDGMGTLDGTFAAAGDVNGDGFADFLVGDGAHDRVDLYRGGNDWTFEVAADLSIVQEEVPGFGFQLTVQNAGPDPVRIRLVDTFPPPLADAAWYCQSTGTPVASGCLNVSSPLSGSIDVLVTMPPGGGLQVGIGTGSLPLPITNTASIVLPVWARDPDSSNNQSTMATGPAETPLFADGFESGDLSAWSSHSLHGLLVRGPAALEGNYGLRAALAGSSGAVVRDDTPEGESTYHARFRFDPKGFGSAGRRAAARDDRQASLLFGTSEGSPRALFGIRLVREAGQLSLAVDASADDGSIKSLTGVSLSEGPHLVDLAWRRASGPGANDGVVVLLFDGVGGGTLSGLDNDAGGGLDEIAWGLDTLVTTTRRPRGGPATVRLDSFASWRIQ